MSSRLRRYWWLLLAMPLLITTFVAPLLAPFPDETLKTDTLVLLPVLFALHGESAIILIVLAGTPTFILFWRVTAVFTQRKHSMWLKGFIWLSVLLGAVLLCRGMALRGNLMEIENFQGKTAVYRLVNIEIVSGFDDDDLFRLATESYSALYECPYATSFCRFKHMSRYGSSMSQTSWFPHLEFESLSGNLYLFHADEQVFAIKNVAAPAPLPPFSNSPIAATNAQHIVEAAHLIGNRPRQVYWLPNGQSFFLEQYPYVNSEPILDLWQYSLAGLDSPRQVGFKEPLAPYGWIGAFNFDRSLVAVVGYEPIDIRETVTGKRLAQLQATDRFSLVAFSPDGQLLVHANTTAGHIEVYDLKTMPVLKLVNTSTNLGPSIAQLVFSPDGRRIATTGNGLWIWDFPAFTGYKLDGELYSAYGNSIAFSPDGSILAVATYGSLNLWDVKTGKKLHSEARLGAYGWIAAFSPNGNILAFAASSDYTIKLLDVSSGQVIRILGGHNYDILNLSFNPAGTLLASTSGDGTVRLWGVQPQ